MAFRRIVLTTERIKELEDDLNRLFSLNKTKIDFPDLKYYIKQGIKPNTLIVDLNGEGADSFSKKIKDAGNKFDAQVQIKLEKTMEKNKITEIIKKVLKEEYDDDIVKYNTEKDDEEYQELSPLEMADGNINIHNFEKFCSIGKGLIKNLIESGYFSDEQECVKLVAELFIKKMSSEYNVPAMSKIFSVNESKKKKK